MCIMHLTVKRKRGLVIEETLDVWCTVSPSWSKSQITVSRKLNRVIPGNWRQECNNTGSGLTSWAGSDGHPHRCPTPGEADRRTEEINKNISMKDKIHVYLIPVSLHISPVQAASISEETHCITLTKESWEVICITLSQTQLTLH